MIYDVYSFILISQHICLDTYTSMYYVIHSEILLNIEQNFILCYVLSLSKNKIY